MYDVRCKRDIQLKGIWLGAGINKVRFPLSNYFRNGKVPIYQKAPGWRGLRQAQPDSEAQPDIYKLMKAVIPQVLRLSS